MADDLDIRSEAEVGEDAENALIAQTLTLSDLSPGSILSIMARTVWAPELASLYAAGLQIAEGFYFQSSAGAALDRRLADLGLARRGPAAAYGQVVFSRLSEDEGGDPHANILIPAGYAVSARDLAGQLITFTVRDDVVLAEHEDAVIAMVDAEQPGSQGNVGSGAIVELTGGAIPNLGGVTNPSAFTPGRDRDSDEQARVLYFQWLEARARTTPAALEYAATSYQEIIDPDLGEDAPNNIRLPIQSASVVEYLDEPGPNNLAAIVYVWGHSGIGLTAEQMAGVRQRINGYTDGAGQEIDGWRAAGILVDAQQGQGVVVDVVVQATLSPGASPRVRDQLRQAITTAMAALGGGRMFRLKAIFDLVCAFGTAFENAKVLQPAGDFEVAPHQKVIPGTVTVQ